jgi:hypothetical protein
MSDEELREWEEKLQDYIDSRPPITNAEIEAELWVYLRAALESLTPQDLHRCLSGGQSVGRN